MADERHLDRGHRKRVGVTLHLGFKLDAFSEGIYDASSSGTRPSDGIDGTVISNDAGDHLLQPDRLAGFDGLLPAAGPEHLDVQLPPCYHRPLPAVPRHCSSGTRAGETPVRCSDS